MSTATINGAGGAGASKQTLKSGSSTNGAKMALDGARKQAASPVDGQGSRKQQSPHPKAWQGTNPITQRASAGLANGTEKPLPKAPQPQSKSSMNVYGDKHAHDRALYLLANFTGCDARLTLKNGEQFAGVFSGASLDSPRQQYILKMVKRTGLPSHQQINGATEMPSEFVGEGEDHMMAFDKEDTVDLSVADVSTISAASLQNGTTSSFRTDTEISGRDPTMPRERELQRWEPSAADASIDMSLGGSGETGWDQFAVNERMYGVQSTYDENIYTTAIDRNSPFYRQREAEAARIAREIEGSAPADAHVAEERRRDAEHGDGVDEEEKYSGVTREATVLPTRKPGAYVPPSQRPITNKPTVPGAPFDPAIVSLTKPPPAPTPPKSKETTEESPSNPASEDQGKPAPIASLAKENTALISSAKKPTENTTEDHVRNVTDSFKQFANNEKLRIRQAQEAKRSSARAEKNVRLNDLKKFAENFKLKSRVPDDLVPILAKDREKQVEIQTKAEEAAKDDERKRKEREALKAAGVASPTPGSTTSAQTISPGTTADQRMAVGQHPRARGPQGMRQPMGPAQGLSPRTPQGPGMQHGQRGFGRPGMPPPPQPLPADLRIPSGPAMPAPEAGPLSPTSQTRLNVKAKAFEFRPGAMTFEPAATTPTASPSRPTQSSAATNESVDFFDHKAGGTRELRDFAEFFNPLKRMTEECTEDQKKAFAVNGGVPQPYRTPPTWPVNDDTMNTSYRDAFPKSRVTSHGPSPMHTPNPSQLQMPHAHQLPAHLQGPQVSTPSQRPPYMGAPHHGHPQGYDPRMGGQFGPGGSVQSSPRFPQAQMAFGGMPQFAHGQQMAPPYGMSPSMQYRQVNMPPGAPMNMMMVPGQPGHGQMPPMQQSYMRGPPPQFAPGGVPMMQQPSGSFMNGPMPQQSYSPMPPHATPHMQHMSPHPNPGAYNQSPRPHMMQQTGSHQGFQPGGHMHMPQPPYGHMPPGGQGYGGGYHMGQRQMSSGPHLGHPAMTPRQAHAQMAPGGQGGASPGMMGGGEGDGGK